MTVVSSDQRPTGDDPAEDLSTPAAGDEGTTEERPKRELPEFLRRVSWRFFLFAPLLLVLIVLAPMLAWKGFDILRTEDTGRSTSRPTIRTPPGFQALVTPTPTTVAGRHRPDGSLAGVTLITLPSQEGGGNIVFLPVGTLLDVPFRTPPEATLADIHAEAGMAGLEQRLETMLGAGIGEVVRVPTGQWANLVAPVAPLTVQNPVAVETTDAAGQPLSFPEGEIQLTAAQVGPYLQADTDEQTDTVRLSRHEAFWTAWLAALDEAGADAVPGEGEGGIGGAVRGLTGGPRNLQILPATPVPIPGVPIVESDLFRPDVLAILATVPEIIPFPQGVGRLRTRLVMGVEGQTDRLGEVAHTLVQAGAQINVIANAEAFGEEETVVVYFGEADREKAQRLLDALGTGALVKETSLSDTVDVVVVLGQDYIDSLGVGTPATTVPAGGTVPLVTTPPEGGVTPGLPGGETTG